MTVHGVRAEGAGVRKSIAGRGLLALTIAVASLLPVLAHPAAAGAVPGSVTSLPIDPSSGPPGTTVTASVAVPAGSSCTFDSLEFGGKPLQAYESSRTDSSIEVTSQVPADAPVGLQRVLVTVQCPADPATCSPGTCATPDRLQSGGSFEVTEPLTRRVVVPDLIGKTLPEATDALGKRLKLGAVSGDGRVVDQSPDPGTEVDPGSSVDVTLEPSPPPSSPTPPPVSTTDVATPASVDPRSEEPSGLAGGWITVLVIVAAVLLGAVAATRLLRRNGRHELTAHRVTVRVRPDDRPSASVRERPGGGRE
jgi:hypothetical protein